MTTLETLLNDPDAAGAWNLVPDRSAITFRIKTCGACSPSKAGSPNSVAAVSCALTARSRDTSKSASPRCAPESACATSTCARLTFRCPTLPQIRVVVTELHPATGNHADLRANFTIKGITDPVPLPVTVTEFGDGSVRISGEAHIDRTQFGLGWNRLGMIDATATASAEAVFARASQ